MKVLANVYRIIYSTDWTKYQTAIVAAQNTRKAEILLEARLRQSIRRDT